MAWSFGGGHRGNSGLSTLLLLGLGELQITQQQFPLFGMVDQNIKSGSRYGAVLIDFLKMVRDSHTQALRCRMQSNGGYSSWDEAMLGQLGL